MIPYLKSLLRNPCQTVDGDFSGRERPFGSHDKRDPVNEVIQLYENFCLVEMTNNSIEV
jgi:hypothetical protein